MARELHLVLSDLRALHASDFFDSNPRGPQILRELCNELRELHAPEASAPIMFDVMERLDNVDDLGSPGLLVHTLEQWTGTYERFLVASLARKPSPLAVWMVNRILNAKPADSLRWLGLLDSVEVHPMASPQTKRNAKHYLNYQQAD